MAFEVPLRSDLPEYEFGVQLDGETFNLRFGWNGRIERWSFSIFDADNSAIVEGMPVFVQQLPLDRFKDERLPPGALMFVDTTGLDVDPARDDLGVRVKLYYLEEADLV